MSRIALSGNPSGTGTLTIAAPNTNSDATINLPTVTGGDFIVSNASGNVGIGTSDPEGKLHVLSGSAGAVTAPGNFPLVLEGTTVAGMSVLTSNTGEGRIWFGDPDDNDVGRIEYAHSTNAMTFRTNASDRMVIDSSGNLQFNSGYGSVATAFGCRAWVNFNGTGTVAIRASGNVSSITDGGTGVYTVNFTTALPDGNYAVGSSFQRFDETGQFLNIGFSNGTAGFAVEAFRAGGNTNTAVLADFATLSLVVMR